MRLEAALLGRLEMETADSSIWLKPRLKRPAQQHVKSLNTILSLMRFNNYFQRKSWKI